MWQVVGQDRAVALLENSLRRQEVAHAYLFVGPPHVGKGTLALNLAQALNCPAPDSPCGLCPTCQRIADRKHADVVWMELARDEKGGHLKKEISTEQVKEVERFAQLPPYEGRFKVFIVDGAEYLSAEASNRFLKTLEEPPPHVVFILLASRERAVLPTVVSRCQRLDLHPLSPVQAEEALRERWHLPPSQAHLLARLSGGCLGWAVTADEAALRHREELLARFSSLAQAEYGERFAFAAELARQWERDREADLRTLQLWVDWWRDMLLIKQGLGHLITNLDQEREMERQARVFPLPQITGAIRALLRVREELQRNANPGLALEVLMLNLPQGQVVSQE